MPTHTAEEVRQQLRRNGVSITEWAKAHGFKASLVYEVLSGSRKCWRGQSHRIAVLLGIKEGAIVQAKDVTLLPRSDT